MGVKNWTDDDVRVLVMYVLFRFLEHYDETHDIIPDDDEDDEDVSSFFKRSDIGPFLDPTRTMSVDEAHARAVEIVKHFKAETN